MTHEHNITIDNHLPAAAGEDTRRLWIRLGVSLQITAAEEAILFGDDREAATEALRHILAEERFTPDGDSYIPEPTVEEYNKEYGTKYEPGEYDFDIYVRPCGIGKENNRWIKSLLNNVPARVIS